MPQPSALLRQLENARFERALDVSESLAEHRALLTTLELERINNILTGKTEDPWRQEPITLTLPSGREERLELHENMKLVARTKLHRATELAEQGSTIDAAVDIYVELVLTHVFKDANRRSAVLAAHYFLRRYGVSVSGLAIHELGLGDLRDPQQVEGLRKTIHQMAQFSSSQNKDL